MRLSPLVLLSAALAGCPSEKSDQLPALRVAEPTPGQVLGQCRIRVRTEKPKKIIASGDNLAWEAHVNWRVDGGTEHAVDVFSEGDDPTAPFLFPAVVKPDTKKLEIGHCDEVDYCTWTAVDVTVSPKPFTPDCAAPNGGLWSLSGAANALGAQALPDGSIVVNTIVHDGACPHGQGEVCNALRVLRPDGRSAATFGGKPVELPVNLAGAWVSPRGDGGWNVLVGPAWFVALDPQGHLDAGKGQRGLEDSPIASFATVDAAPDGAGGFYAVGLSAGAAGSGPAIVHLGEDRVEKARFVITDLPGDLLAAKVRSDGRFAVLVKASAGAVLAGGDVNGLDARLGRGGRDLVGQVWSGATVGLRGDAIVAVDPHWGAEGEDLRLVELAPGVALKDVRARIGLGASSDQVLTAEDKTGGFYVVATANRGQPGTGTRLLAARFANGALDPAFGNAGVLVESLSDVLGPAESGVIHDVPLGLAVGADGAPWIVGRTDAGAPEAERPDLARSGVVMLRLKP